MTGTNIFKTRSLVILIAVSVTALVASLILMAVSEDASVANNANANVFSRSAIGHRALIESMKATGYPVLISQFNSLEKSKDAALLALLEPQPNGTGRRGLETLLQADNLLLVLPKRYSNRSLINPGWAEETSLYGAQSVETVLKIAVPDGTVLRPGDDQSDIAADRQYTLALPDPQLIKSGELTPIIGDAEGMLLGYRQDDSQVLWVLSDPDILATHGLGKADNAKFIFSVLTSQMADHGVIVVDETIHGFRRNPSLSSNLVRPPILYVLISAVILAAALLAASTQAFGSRDRGDEPAFEGNKQQLINNTVDLLHFGGYQADITTRYFDQILRDVAIKLHAPPGLDRARLAKWIDAVGDRKGVTKRYQAIRTRYTHDMARRGSSQQFLVGLARELSIWQQEILNGH